MSTELQQSSEKGLSDAQKNLCIELLVDFMQGTLDMNGMRTLASIKSRDPQFFLDQQLMFLKGHPEFASEGEFVNNMLKTSALEIQLERVKSQTRVDMSKKENMDVATVNRLMKMSKLDQPRDGKKVGLGGTDNNRKTLVPENKDIPKVIDIE